VGKGERRRFVYTCGDGQHVSRAQLPVDKKVQSVVLEYLRTYSREISTDETDGHTVAQERSVLQARLDGLAIDYADGILTREQVQAATTRIRQRLDELAGRHLDIVRPRVVLDGLAGHADVADRWEALSLDRKRAVVAECATVTIGRSVTRGRVFDLSTIGVDLKS
jgi:hypothetical protein